MIQVVHTAEFEGYTIEIITDDNVIFEYRIMRGDSLLTQSEQKHTGYTSALVSAFGWVNANR